MDPTKLRGVPRPRSEDNISHVLTVNDLQKQMEAKRVSVLDAVLGCNVQIAASTHWAALTSPEALAAARVKANRDAQKRIREQVEERSMALAAAWRAHT